MESVEELNIIDVKIVDVQDGCYLVEDEEGVRYKLPAGIGSNLAIQNDTLLQIAPNTFWRLNEPQGQPESQQWEEEENNQRIIEDPSCSNLNLWRSSRHQSEEDIKATVEFLTLRTSEKYENLFTNKKTVKSKVWKKLVQDMELKGFHLGSTGSERLRQKYYNLQKQYTNLILNSRKTGAAAQPLPIYYELLCKLFGKKDSIHPTFTIDSLKESNVSHAAPGTSQSKLPASASTANKKNQEGEYSDENDPQTSISRQHHTILKHKPKKPSDKHASEPSTSHVKACIDGQVNVEQNHSEENVPQMTARRQHCKTSVKPKSNADKFIEVIKNLHKEQNDRSDGHFRKLENLLMEQNKIKKNFLKAYEKVHGIKRKGSFSSDD